MPSLRMFVDQAAKEGRFFWGEGRSCSFRNPVGNVTNSYSVSKIRIVTGGIPLLPVGTSPAKVPLILHFHERLQVRKPGRRVAENARCAPVNSCCLYRLRR